MIIVFFLYIFHITQHIHSCNFHQKINEIQKKPKNGVNGDDVFTAAVSCHRGVAVK